jgi:hypothetical protein
MAPLSYQGFGFTAIMLMLGVLCLNQAIRFVKDYLQKQNQKKSTSGSL